MNSNRSKSLVPGLLVLSLALGAALPACAQKKAESTPSNGVLAVVNGKNVTEADIQKAAADQFQALDREYAQKKHELLESQLDMVIQDRLLEAEAAARGVTKEALLAEIKPAAVTDAEVDAFYEQNKAQIPRPKDQVADQIKNYLQQQSGQKAQQDFYKSLESKYKVDIKMEPIRVEVAATGPAKGPANAPITIVEFSDFQCPFCSRVNPTLEQVREKYGDKVRIVFRQYPLPFHQQAAKAAEASLCANEQGKFWEMHDALFANQSALQVEQLKEQATKLGLNAEQFNTCLDSNKHAATVQTDLKEGQAAGVNGTPAMFINGRFISGAVPFEQVAQVIDDELRRKGVNTASK